MTFCFYRLFICVYVSLLFFLSVTIPLAWVKGAFRGVGEVFKSCVWGLVCVSGSVGGARDRFTPHIQTDEGYFPARPFFSFPCFSKLADWRWSSLISPEPTGLFFHLHILSSYCQWRTFLHIFFLFKSVADFHPNHFLLSAKCCIFVFPLSLYPCSWEM